MNGKLAKRLRREVYDDKVTGPAANRKYLRHVRTGQIVAADVERKVYQALKRDPHAYLGSLVK